MNEDVLNWLKKQHTVTIVQEAGQTRIGRWVPGPNGMMLGMTWTQGPDLLSALKGAAGLDMA